MGIYVGCINKVVNKDGTFYNFKPMAEVKNMELVPLSSSDQEKLLPDSEKGNILFDYNWNNNEHQNKMDDMFSDNSLAVFEFTTEDLQDHLNRKGDRYPTGYKVAAIDMIKANKIRPIVSDGIYYLIDEKDLLSDFYNDSVVDINTAIEHIKNNDKLFIQNNDFNDFYAGPYEVGFRKRTSSFYIKPEIEENKYTISGYRKDFFKKYSMSDICDYWDWSDNSLTLIVIQDNAVVEQIDVIGDERLLEEFRENISSDKTSNGVIDLSDISTLIKSYEDSIISGGGLSDYVRKERVVRLSRILESELDIDNLLKNTTDIFCNLLIRNKNMPSVEDWLSRLIEENPEFLNQVKETRAISEHISKMEQKLTDLEQQRDLLEEDIEQKKQDANELNKAAIEAKKEELLNIDAKYTEKLDKLNKLEDELKIAEEMSDLLKERAKYQKDVDYLENHKLNLQNETKDLELQFQTKIGKYHNEMVNIAFDGFMANKMFSAAANWETEDYAKKHRDLVIEVNNTQTVEKKPNELIEYLCRTIQTVRPTYDKNTIINIAICMTQGFLTVFSGEPGCGKTSICNFFSDALGLNKISKLHSKIRENINRYVFVSVEKGWTSKRDLIGYYNPLSKTFDKSNSQVYNALYQLDTEKRENICKLPYIIMLDEANLSQMEYYWSDFMNICNDINHQSSINLGEDFVFEIPETLHFFATINNDHTVEKLSPRLIDRAWIITLPKQNNIPLTESSIPLDQIEIIDWQSLRKAFIPDKEACVFSNDVQKIYETVSAKMKEQHFSISNRLDIAIKLYWTAASKYFEQDETKIEAEIVALDYAVSQRLLPKINGNGDEFRKWLDEFKSLCNNRGLNMSAQILKDIIDSGDRQMKYYEFFC